MRNLREILAAVEQFSGKKETLEVECQIRNTIALEWICESLAKLEHCINEEGRVRVSTERESRA